MGLQPFRRQRQQLEHRDRDALSVDQIHTVASRRLRHHQQLNCFPKDSRVCRPLLLARSVVRLLPLLSFLSKPSFFPPTPPGLPKILLNPPSRRAYREVGASLETLSGGILCPPPVRIVFRRSRESPADPRNLPQVYSISETQSVRLFLSPPLFVVGRYSFLLFFSTFAAFLSSHTRPFERRAG